MNINWEEINEKYPKAYYKFFAFIYISRSPCYRDIESFFDNYMAGRITSERRLIERVLSERNNYVLTKEIIEKAKEQAIYKAFEILENKLRSSNG